MTRNADDRAALEALGDQAYFLQLQGFIFFGTANGLLEQVRARARATPTRYVALDFRQVIGLDSTALLSFDKMRQLARESGFTLLLGCRRSCAASLAAAASRPRRTSRASPLTWIGRPSGARINYAPIRRADAERPLASYLRTSCPARRTRRLVG